jgi:uncharacterized protein with PQ loop repeat
MSSLAVLAGSVSTVLFAVSTLPMLIKAARTKELDSYSRGNLVLANVGNAVHSIYVFQMPLGPIWVLHTFYIVASGLMLCWHLRYAKASRRSNGVPFPTGGSHDDRMNRNRDHRRRRSRSGDRLPPAEARTPVRDPRRQPKNRRQLAHQLGLATALHPGGLERASRPALPRSEMVLSDQG